MSTSRGHETVHSDDGQFHIRLGNAITAPKTKIPGSSVAVFHGTMLKLKKSASKKVDDGQCKMAYRPPTPISLPGGSDCESPLDEITVLQEVTPIDDFDEQIFGPRVPHPPSSSLQDIVAPVYEEGEEIVIKIFTVIPTSWSRADTEIAALKHLTEHECKHAPTYLCDFDKQSEDAKGGVVRYVVMTKLPGYALDDSDAWTDPSTLRRVKNAFKVAIGAVHACGVDNGSHFGRNILWDQKDGKCYIVDFERAEFYHSATRIPAGYTDFGNWVIDY